MRVGLLTDGGYPYTTGESRLWCDRLVRGLARHEFDIYALSRTAAQEERGWVALPPQVRRVRTAPLWAPQDGGHPWTRGRAGRAYGRRERHRFAGCFRELADAICADGTPGDPGPAADRPAPARHAREGAGGDPGRGAAGGAGLAGMPGVAFAGAAFVGGPVAGAAFTPEEEAATGPAAAPAGGAARFAEALYGLADLARESGGLHTALRSETAVRILEAACRAPGANRAVATARVPDYLAFADLLERALRPLSLDWYDEAGLGDVDLCHAAGGGSAALPGLLAKRFFGVPLLVTEYGVQLRTQYLASSEVPAPVRALLAAFHRRLAVEVYERAALITPGNTHTRRWQEKCGADRAKLRTVYPGMAAERFQTVGEEPNGGDPATLVWVGRIDPTKDLIALLHAFAEVRRAEPDARLRIFYAARPTPSYGPAASVRGGRGEPAPDGQASGTDGYAYGRGPGAGGPCGPDGGAGGFGTGGFGTGGTTSAPAGHSGAGHAAPGGQGYGPAAYGGFGAGGAHGYAGAAGLPPESAAYLAHCRALAAQLFPDEAADAHAVGDNPVSFEEIGGPEAPELADAYGSGSVVVLSSVVEGFPVSLVEAMFCGRATVSTDAGAVVEVIGGTGLVVPPRNPRALADACVALLRDPERRERLGAAARARALELFTVEQNLAAFRGIYLELMSHCPVQRDTLDGSGDPVPFAHPAEAHVPGNWTAATAPATGRAPSWADPAARTEAASRPPAAPKTPAARTDTARLDTARTDEAARADNAVHLDDTVRLDTARTEEAVRADDTVRLEAVRADAARRAGAAPVQPVSSGAEPTVVIPRASTCPGCAHQTATAPTLTDLTVTGLSVTDLTVTDLSVTDPPGFGSAHAEEATR
ncbi:DUF3492 domain-containing protein [Streptomyces sp. cg36]|uniref:DUF3492 domain-containing protein n=1 Tax=Streptomyces sp. cg36 TaxID=3238798 RepID=UPI0034E1C2FC